MNYIYAPGCALLCYKPHLADKLKSVVMQMYGEMETLTACCFNRPQLMEDVRIITPCTTCAQQYIKNYPQCTVEFFLTTLAESDVFPFPDYGGVKMSVQDTCSARSDSSYLATVRKLMQRMNIQIVEAEKSGVRSKCCGQTFYGKLPNEKVVAFMKMRAEEMPVEDVVVYCASCIMSMIIGGKRPRYILDLLFNEPTEMLDADIEGWNRKLLAFRKANVG